MFATKVFAAVSALVLTIAIASPRSANAGGRIGLLGGGAIPLSSVEFESEGEKFGVDLGAGPAIGLEGGWMATDSLEVGGLVLGSLLEQERDETAASWSATAGLRYSFFDTESKVRPFVVGHLGYYGVAVDSEDSGDGWFDFDFSPFPDESDGGFGVNAGGGVDFYPVKWLSVGVDLRYHHAFVFEGVDTFTTMAGVAWHFG
jgi:hypothetical protein